MKITFPEPLEDPLPAVKIRRLSPDASTDPNYKTSWIGGLPLLGGEPWPTNKSGQNLHHLASISLVELAQYLPKDTVPNKGHLSFFVGFEGDRELEARVLLTNASSESELPPEMPSVEEFFGVQKQSGSNCLTRSPIKLGFEPVTPGNFDDAKVKAYSLWSTAYDAGTATMYWDSAYKLLNGLQVMVDEEQISAGIEHKLRASEIWQRRLGAAQTEQEKAFPIRNLNNERLALDGLTTQLSDYK